MIADFEKKQMDSGIKLSTDEHIKEELKFLNDIVCILKTEYQTECDNIKHKNNSR